MREKLNVAMPIPSFLPNMGGMEIGLHNIASRLKERGHNPIVICPFTQYRALKNQGYTFDYAIHPYLPKMSSLCLKYPRIAQWVYTLYYRYIHKYKKIDVWHATMAYPEGTSISQAFAGKNVPMLMRSAGADIQINERVDYGLRRNPEIDSLIRKWLLKIPALIAITDTVKNEYLKINIPAEKIHIITNGVDTERFSNHSITKDIREQYNIPKDHFIFLSVGRNHAKKNYITLLKSAAELKKSYDHFTLLIVGDATSDLKSEVIRLKVEDHVRLIEQIGGNDLSKLSLPGDDLLDLYKSADAFVFPSQIETFGIAIIEAMAAHLPCIVSNAPGCINVIDKGKYALTFDPLDMKAIANHMKNIINDPDLRETYRKKSALRAHEYDWNAVVDQYENLYYQLIDRPKPQKKH